MEELGSSGSMFIRQLGRQLYGHGPRVDAIGLSPTEERNNGGMESTHALVVNNIHK